MLGTIKEARSLDDGVQAVQHKRPAAYVLMDTHVPYAWTNRWL